MGHTKRNYTDVESKAGLHFLREELGCENLGVSVIDVEDGREGPAHDHADDDQEEIYVLVEGEAQVTVEGESVTLAPGDALRVDPEATRRVELVGNSLMVVVGAP